MFCAAAVQYQYGGHTSAHKQQCAHRSTGTRRARGPARGTPQWRSERTVTRIGGTRPCRPPSWLRPARATQTVVRTHRRACGEYAVAARASTRAARCFRSRTDLAVGDRDGVAPVYLAPCPSIHQSAAGPTYVRGPARSHAAVEHTQTRASCWLLAVAHRYARGTHTAWRAAQARWGHRTGPSGWNSLSVLWSLVLNEFENIARLARTCARTHPPAPHARISRSH